MSDSVPQDIQKQVMAMKKDIADGKVAVFTGPVKDQAGKVRINKGAVAPDKDLLGMTWFVQGVIGTTE
jgi:basic membrane protein A